MAGERGRPQATTPAAIIDVAFTLFHEVGFTATTMSAIARGAGISRSTLFRHFPNKAAIFWHSQSSQTELFRSNLAAQPRGIDLVDGVFAAYAATWTGTAHELAIGKEMIRTVETSPPEATGKWQANDAWGAVIHGFVLDRTGLPESDTGARAAAGAIWAAIWAAASAFALAESDTLGEHLDSARAAIDVRIRPRTS